MSMMNPVSLILLVTAGGLGALAYQQSTSPVILPDHSSAADPALPEVGQTSPLISAPLSNFQEVLERPLFSQTRQVDVIENTVEAAPSRPTRKPDLSLSGIVMSEGEQIALLSQKRDPKIERLSVGDKIDGWTITAISPRLVTLSAGGDNIQLELLRKSDPKQASLRQRANSTPAPNGSGNLAQSRAQSNTQSRSQGPGSPPVQDPESLRSVDPRSSGNPFPEDPIPFEDDFADD